MFHTEFVDVITIYYPTNFTSCAVMIHETRVFQSFAMLFSIFCKITQKFCSYQRSVSM